MSSSPQPAPGILTINAGSSSIKLALFEAQPALRRLMEGQVERIGLPGTRLSMTDVVTGRTEQVAIQGADHAACIGPLLDRVEQRVGASALQAVGHRIVHGGAMYSRPEPVTPAVIAELRRISSYDPEHLPAAIGLMELFARRYPRVPHIACFDTTFHRDLPRVARLLAIPRRYDKLGIRRYGFHGLSYAYLMKELAGIGASGEAEGRVILAHLGNGASMTAVLGGKSLETTMGFTPASGLPMSRRSGDLDPGVMSYLTRTEGLTVEQFHTMVNSESGLLGLSESSSDIRDLLALEAHDPRASEAVALFCYQAKKAIGALAAALGGVDTLVFSAGIGEHSPAIRARICDGLGFLGIAIDARRNKANDAVISAEQSRAIVRVIPTDEARELAHSVFHLLATTGEEG
ncbi:acetate/propionate family kinase [Nitrospira lenta]|nr:acetate/propionate family kinase [Nitrospira lenta]